MLLHSLLGKRSLGTQMPPSHILPSINSAAVFLLVATTPARTTPAGQQHQPEQSHQQINHSPHHPSGATAVGTQRTRTTRQPVLPFLLFTQRSDRHNSNCENPLVKPARLLDVAAAAPEMHHLHTTHHFWWCMAVFPPCDPAEEDVPCWGVECPCEDTEGYKGGGFGGGGGWHKASVSDCLPLAAPIGLSPLLILTLCGPKRVLVVSTEPPDDLSCLTTRGVGCPENGAVARAVDQGHPDAHFESMRGFADSSTDLSALGCASAG